VSPEPAGEHYFSARPGTAHRPGRVHVLLPDVHLELETDSGVFSPSRLDAGTRLLQSAYEASQFAQRLDSAAILHLQLGVNLVQRPDEGAEKLLGLSAAAPA